MLLKFSASKQIGLIYALQPTNFNVAECSAVHSQICHEYVLIILHVVVRMPCLVKWFLNFKSIWWQFVLFLTWIGFCYSDIYYAQQYKPYMQYYVQFCCSFTVVTKCFYFHSTLHLTSTINTSDLILNWYCSKKETMHSHIKVICINSVLATGILINLKQRTVQC